MTISINYEDLLSYESFRSIEEFIGVIISKKRPTVKLLIVKSSGILCTVGRYNCEPFFPYAFERRHFIGKQLRQKHEAE